LASVPQKLQTVGVSHSEELDANCNCSCFISKRRLRDSLKVIFLKNINIKGSNGNVKLPWHLLKHRLPNTNKMYKKYVALGLLI